MKRTKAIALIGVVVLIATFSVGLFAHYSANNALEKFSDEMIRHLDDEDIGAYIWFEEPDVDYEKEKDAYVMRELGFNEDDVKKFEKDNLTYDGEMFDEQGEFTQGYVDFVRETKSKRHEAMSMMNAIIDKQREYAEKLFREYNLNAIENAGITTNNIAYTCLYSPCVIVSTDNKATLLRIAKCDQVTYVGYHNNEVVSEETNPALTAVGASYVRDTLGYDGYGVKAGVYDSGRVDKTVSDLSNSLVTVLNTSMSISTHSTNVTRIINGSGGVAPQAHVYSNSSTTSAEQGIEALINKNVSVINISLEFSRDENDYYNDFEKWIDHISHQHHMTVVVSSGNNGVGSTVAAPGLAYNVITVGGMDTKNTSSTDDDTIYSNSATNGSCAGNGGANGCAKPDFLAPHTFSGISGGGTSYSAPVVTGIIAQMIECKPSIATEPAVIKAVLTSSTIKKVAPNASPSVAETWAGPITAQQGAGVVSAKKAISILSAGKYWVGYVTTSGVTKNINVTSSDLYIRPSIAWTRPNTTTTHTTISATAGVAANMRLRIYKPDGTLRKTADKTNTSVELAHFNVQEVYGTYKAKIDRVDSGTNSVWCALAWR